jgi:hypothetical protein
MPAREVVTRDSLRRELVVNAATKPLAIGVAAAVAVAAFLIGTPWLLVVAAALYLALAGATLLDPNEAERVGKEAYERAGALTGPTTRALPPGLAPEIASLLERARAEEWRIFETVSESELTFDGVMADVGSLTTEMERIAGRAQSIWKYLSEQRPEDARSRLRELRDAPATSPEADRARERAADAVQDQLRLGETLEGELGRFAAEMEHLIASLGIVHGQLVRMSVANDTHLQEDVARELSDLRERVSTFADGMRDAVARLDD